MTLDWTRGELRPETLTDAEILERLLAINHERDALIGPIAAFAGSGQKRN